MAMVILSLVFSIAIFSLISIFCETLQPTKLNELENLLSRNEIDIEQASNDFGGMIKIKPLAVFQPTTADDVARLLRHSYESKTPYFIAARGHGHSVHGQAMTSNGIVIEMKGLKGSLRKFGNISMPVSIDYIDVSGGDLWIDVLESSLQYGFAPKSWTDYLYLTVGGTLSYGGISGQAFNYGPQTNNVFELDVVTGKGDIVTCSEEQNSELFHGVLGGLGQFGIITRARIALEPAPERVRWIRVLYSDFTTFTRDQEYLISLHDRPAAEKFDYVEGFVVVEEGLINNWRSSFFSPSNPIKINSIPSTNGVLYCLEVTKNYDKLRENSVDQEIESLMKKLNYIPVSVFTTDLPYIDFLDRVHKSELKLRAKDLWDVPHPWLNLFIPRSRIIDFDAGVFKGILGRNKASGPILIYPINRNKWDDRNSVVTPDEDVFYLVGFLRSVVDSDDETQSLEYLTNQNQQILKFCEDHGIKAKMYLPHYKTQEEWKIHFGEKWQSFAKKKNEFDPKGILSPGQRIFDSSW